MRILLFVLAVLAGTAAIAQFPYNPLPFKMSDFKKIKEEGYKHLYIYEITDAQQTLAWHAEYGYQGMIKALYKKVYESSEDPEKDQDTLNETATYYRFDGKGRLDRETEESRERGDESISAYTYNAAGKLVMKQTATIDPPTYKYKYDAAGKLKEVTVTQKMPVWTEGEEEWSGKTFDKPAGRSLFKYDAKGRLTEEWCWLYDDKSPKPESKILWTYNAKGQVAKIKRVNSDGEEINSETFEYNADGLLSASSFKDGAEVKKYVFKYCKDCRP